MPYEISHASFDAKLNLSATNIAHTTRFLERGVNPFQLPDWLPPQDYQLRVSKKADEYRLIHTDTNKTVYAVKLRFRDDIAIGDKPCTQVRVWCSLLPQHDLVVQGLAQRFFNCLLRRYAIVLTDEEPIPEGRTFWVRRIAWSLSFGHFVYVSDSCEGDRLLTPVVNYEEFYLEKWSDLFWGRDPETHTYRLVVISTEPLIPEQ